MRPSGRRVFAVRYRKADRVAVDHRLFLRRHAARRFLDKLHAAGREAELFVSAVTWRTA